MVMADAEVPVADVTAYKTYMRTAVFSDRLGGAGSHVVSGGRSIVLDDGMDGHAVQARPPAERSPGKNNQEQAVVGRRKPAGSGVFLE